MLQECTNEEIGRLIALYELNQLNERDRRRFEEHILECASCFQELKEMRPLVVAMRDERSEILKRLSEEGVSFAEQKRLLEEAYRERGAKSEALDLSTWLNGWMGKLLRPRIWIPAAAVALLLVIFVWPISRTHNPYLPYLDYSKAPYGRVAFRGPVEQNEEAQKAFDAGMAEYQRDNLVPAIKQLEKAVRLAPDSGQYWFYLGVCHYLSRRAKPAIEALNRALTAGAHDLKPKARWYLAQTYLLKGQPGLALPLLEESVRGGGVYSIRADSLLHIIGSIKQTSR